MQNTLVKDTQAKYKPKPGYELFSLTNETCKKCGQIYEKAIVISPYGLVVTDRNPCSCILRNPKKNLAEQTQRAQETIEVYFGAENLINASTTMPDIKNISPRIGQESAVGTLLKIAEKDASSVLLFGPQGRGKSFLALATARYLKKQHNTVLAVKTIDLLNKMRATSWQSQTKYKLMSILRSVDVLVLDDIGTEKLTDFVYETFYAIIDHRYERKNVKTIYTTNLTGSEMATKLGGPLTSRIWGGLQLHVGGKDWRIAK